MIIEKKMKKIISMISDSSGYYQCKIKVYKHGQMINNFTHKDLVTTVNTSDLVLQDGNFKVFITDQEIEEVQIKEFPTLRKILIKSGEITVIIFLHT